MSLELEPEKKYDPSAFAADVDEAIGDLIRLVESDRESGVGKNLQAAVPRLRADMSTSQVMFEVCLAMSVREMVAAPRFREMLFAALQRTKQMLLAKNAAYGDSALSPVRIFSTVSLKEQLLVRIDDKVSRLVRGSDAGEDVVADLLGYFVLLRIAVKREGNG